MRSGSMSVGAAVLLALAGCSSEPEQQGTKAPGVSTPVGGTPAAAASGSAGKPAAVGGIAGTTAPVVTPPPPVTTTPTTGTVKPPTAGTSAVAGGPAATPAGTAAVAGASAAAGSSAAAAGSGAAAAGSSAQGNSKDGFMRGPAPTMDSVMKNGPYQVKNYADGIKDGAEFLAATIYYPVDADPPFAGIVACPGFTAYQDSVAPWGPFLASHGIVLMTIDTNTTGDSVDVRQGALLDALASLKAEQTRSGSPLNGKLDMTRFGLMGWSMGGGGTWLNANTHPELKSAMSLAGHIATQIGGAGQFTKVTVPTLLLAGDADTGILGLAMSQPVYESIPDSTPKILYEVSGASHFDIQPQTGNNLFGMYGLSWQKVFLEGDMRYKQFLMLPKPSNASDFKSNVK